MLGLYIHIPFCKKKCNYCNFVSYADKEDLIDTYLTAIEKELSRYLLLSTLNSQLSTLYIGGGTPSILSVQQLKYLFEILKKNFNLQVVSEITFEANPESLTADKLKTLKEFCVNRLSIGIQSFNDDILKFLGRIHTVRDAQEKFLLARNLGFENINIDLIYGIPHQTLTDWQKTLKAAVKLHPEHISAYCLTIEPETEFAKMYDVPDDDLQAEMYKFTIEYLQANEYKHYEISNFALSGFESKHNINYWQNGEYLGIGAGATSHINGMRIRNSSNLNEYINNAGKKTTIEEYEKLTEEQKLSEEIILGLRMRCGVVLTEQILNRYNKIIDRFTEEGFLKVNSGKLALTENVLFVSNRILSEFV